MDKILKILSLDTGIINQKIYKKYFYETNTLNSSQKKLIKSNIEDIKLISMAKDINLNIPSYEDDSVQYLEIAIIEVKLKEDGRYREISEILNRTIQYPTFIFLNYGDKLNISLCLKRKNQQTGENNVIEDILVVEDFYSNSSYEDYLISLMYIDKTNIYNYYRDLYKKTYTLEISRDIDNFERISKGSLEDVKALSKEIDEIDIKIDSFKTKIGEEHDIGRRVDYNMKMKKLEKKREKLFKRLEEL